MDRSPSAARHWDGLRRCAKFDAILRYVTSLCFAEDEDGVQARQARHMHVQTRNNRFRLVVRTLSV